MICVVDDLWDSIFEVVDAVSCLETLSNEIQLF